MMARGRRRFFAQGACMLALMGCIGSTAHGEEASASLQRADFAKQKEAARIAHDDGRRQCYQRLAVTDCLDVVDANHREQLAEIRRQELALNEQERKARTAARVSSLERKAAQPARDSVAPRDEEARIEKLKRKEADRVAKAKQRSEQAKKRRAEADKRRQDREQK